jgi:isopropylmalate/homocitrate/citramalate synthase
MPKQTKRDQRLSTARRAVVYDTTLRDGAQGSWVSFSASDKLRIARTLDGLGFDYIRSTGKI